MRRGTRAAAGSRRKQDERDFRGLNKFHATTKTNLMRGSLPSPWKYGANSQRYDGQISDGLPNWNNDSRGLARFQSDVTFLPHIGSTKSTTWRHSFEPGENDRTHPRMGQSRSSWKRDGPAKSRDIGTPQFPIRRRALVAQLDRASDFDLEFSPTRSATSRTKNACISCTSAEFLYFTGTSPNVVPRGFGVPKTCLRSLSQRPAFGA